MLKPLVPPDETARLLSLHSLRILDTPPEERLDRITRMGQRLFSVEICLISFVDANRQWFKSRQGIDICETSRENSFCGHAILDDAIFIVTDAADDVRFADNPLVTGPPGVRFYAGCPIRSGDGHRLGTICLIDIRPRELTREDGVVLRDLAEMVEDELSASSQVSVDELTRIANRRGFSMVAGHMLSLCQRTGSGAWLLYFDLDGFKAINDSEGPAAGDALLQLFAKLLVRCFRNADVIARMGGDEFVVLMTASGDTCDVALARLQQMTADDSESGRAGIAWSTGKVAYDAERHQTVEDLLAEGDSRMYEDRERRRLGSLMRP